MSSADGSSQPTPRRAPAKPKKKAPGHFKVGGTSLVQGLLAGAEQVAERSFLGGAGGDAEPRPAAPIPPVPEPAVPAQGSGATPSPVSDVRVAPGPVEADAQDDDTPASGDDAPASAVAHHEPDESASAAVAPPAAVTPPAPIAQPPAPEPVAAPRAVEAPARRAKESAAEAAPARRRPRAGKEWAHSAVLESFASAKIQAESWTTFGFRLDPEVLAELKERMKADRRSTGIAQLSQGHYLDAALRNIPTDVDSQIAMAQAFLDERMGVVNAGRQSTYRVGPQTYALVSTLNQALQEADYGRRGLYIVSAALESLLRALDAEGELKRPGRRGRGQGIPME